VLLRAPW